MRLLLAFAAVATAAAQSSVPQATNSLVVVNPRPKWCPDADSSLSCLCGRVMLGPCPTNVCKTCASSTTGGIEKVPHGEDRTSVVGVDAKYLSQHHLYDTAVALQKCCKICNGQNKACGDRCISKTATCGPPAIAADLPADRYCACDHLPWGPVRPQKLAETKDALPELDYKALRGAKNQVDGDFPFCKVHKNTVYAMCADAEVARWGIGPEGYAKALQNCQWAASTKKKWGHCVHNSKRSDKVAQAAPVTPADPTGRVPKSCTMGSQVVRDGDVVRGVGENFCNSCHCREGTLVCSSRNCAPDRGESGWHSCGEHITCSPHGHRTADGRRHILVKVRHGNQGFSGDHRCRYNVQLQTCACKCRAAPKFGGRQHGVFQFDQRGTTGRSCSSHKFETGFDPAKGDVSVIISPNHRKTNYVHDPPMMWVEGATHTGFTVCMREGERRHFSKDRHDRHLVVSYIAYQGTANRTPQGRDTPFAGALAGYSTVAASPSSGPHCQDVTFAAPFNKVPLVMGSVDFQDTISTSSTEAVTHWLEGVSSTGFRVCFREGGFTSNGLAGFAFNWMAFPHNNPWLWYGNHMPYSEAGTVPSAGLWKYPHRREDKEYSGLMACKTVAFKATYPSVPAVLVTAKHAATTMDLAAEVTHPATMTFVNEVTTTDFEVCSATAFAEGKEATDDELLWSYVVFGANATD